MRKDSNNLFQAAEALLMDYTSIYYVNAGTNAYRWYSFDPQLRSLRLQREGDDFFRDMIQDALRSVYAEDQHIFTEDLTKEKLLGKLKNGAAHNIEYRLMVGGSPVYHSLRLIREQINDEDYFILGVLNVDQEVRERQSAAAVARERRIYTQIAERLAVSYDAIYYVNSKKGNYLPFVSGDIYGENDLREEGEDFFADAQRNARLLVDPEDRDTVIRMMDRDYLITALEEKKQFSFEYNLLLDGQKQRTRMTVMWSNDHAHFIICAENIESEFRREIEQNRALRSANEMARRDELTGVKNKNAYNEFEARMQKLLDQENEIPFAVVVCDLNDLKDINDTRGHKAGDEYIFRACRMICKVFDHSPVFRIGGDEFAVILMKQDYEERQELIDRLRQQVRDHLRHQDGPVLASGMAVYDADRHTGVGDVFHEADGLMYEEKKRLKSGIIAEHDHSRRMERIIPENRRRRLDGLFEALDIVADGSYIFLCDMKYDYSRWSQAAVTTFSMPSEYLYDAGYLWEEHIHPEDRASYHASLDEIFFGNGLEHSMEYRARNAAGEYVSCSCRGIVLKDQNGEPEYFGGAIRTYGAGRLGEVGFCDIQDADYDRLTGLPTSAYFMQTAARFRDRTRRAERIPVMLFLDLNGMKAYNAKYGFDQGDRLLRSVADILRGHFGNENCGRFGPDHFVVYLANEDGPEQELERVFRQIAGLQGGRSLPVRVGLYLWKDAFISPQAACDLAKIACDADWDNRASSYNWFDSSMMESLANRTYILENLDQALEEGWIQAYYQPIVRSVTGRVCNEEALARWLDPERGLLSPADFIPVLEEARLLYRLDLYMVDQIVDQFRRRREAGIKQVPVSVNLSWGDFLQCDMVAEICSRMDEADLPHHLLCIEITERMIGRDPEFMRMQIDRFHEKGFRIWMDDFGSGYSSLDVLRNFEFDLLKFNMEFTSVLESSEKSRLIMTELVHMASKLGIDTLAEGAETAEQVRFLREIGCDKIQGFYFSAANPLDEIIRRYQYGEGIGFELLQERSYYDTVGKANLNDPAISNYLTSKVASYFSGVPMGILENCQGMFRTVRYNTAFEELLRTEMGPAAERTEERNLIRSIRVGSRFRAAIEKTIATGDWEYIDNARLDDITINAFVRKIADNPVTGAKAIVAIFLSMMQEEDNK